MSTPALPDDRLGRGWSVTGQVQTNEMDGSGRFVPGWSVSFVTQLGHVGSVFVPQSMFTPANVAQAVADQAYIMDSVAQLSDRG